MSVFFFVYRNWPFTAKSVPPNLSIFFSTKTSVANFTNLCNCTQSLLFFSFCPQPLLFFFVCPQSLLFFLLWQNFATFVFFFWALPNFLFKVQVSLNGYIAFFMLVRAQKHYTITWKCVKRIPILEKSFAKHVCQNNEFRTCFFLYSLGTGQIRRTERPATNFSAVGCKPNNRDSSVTLGPLL